MKKLSISLFALLAIAFAVSSAFTTNKKTSKFTSQSAVVFNATAGITSSTIPADLTAAGSYQLHRVDDLGSSITTAGELQDEVETDFSGQCLTPSGSEVCAALYDEDQSGAYISIFVPGNWDE